MRLRNRIWFATCRVAARGALHGRHADRKTADFGVDGWTFMEENPIQVKRSERVGRPEVQKFSAAVRAHKKQKGVVVAFSFSHPAYEEAARLKREEDVDIELRTVEEVLS